MKNADSVEDVISFLKKIIAEETNVSPDSIDIDIEFFQFGLDSINSLVLLDQAEKEFGIELNPLFFWDYPTIRSFSEHIFEEFK